MQQQSRTCLLIDDDADDQEIFRVALLKVEPSLRCEFAGDGVVGLQKLEQSKSDPPVFIFIDINMPRMNGLQCLADIRKSEVFRDIPVYMYSTTGEAEIKKQCKKMGARDFFVKSPNIADLEDALYKVMTDVAQIRTA